MYSVKPGRGPSGFGVVGAVVAAVFGVFWTAGAASMGAPPWFVAFGVVFVVLAIAGGVYHFHNATSKNRVSEFDIVRSSEEPDPFAPRAPNAAPALTPPHDSVNGFCPFCGAAVSPEFSFCPKCGKAIPTAN